MKEFIVKHIEEISGTLLAGGAVGVKIHNGDIPVVDWTHVIILPLVSGIVGGLGALMAKLIWNMVRKAYKNWRDNKTKIN